ncbi:MAG: DUF3570 domain-containing protein [Methylococcaceae bacterium]|nr:DUF3570 domain-containing protein [Methylococcaceae bacterium]
MPVKTPTSTPKSKSTAIANASLHALTAAALALPGLTLSPVVMGSDDEVSFQYGHYQEGKRDLANIRSNLKPIEVDSLQGSARVSLTDRVKFAFNYLQDTWSGATPISTAPLAFRENYVKSTTSGASPYIMPSNLTPTRLDAQLNPLMLDPATGKFIKNTQLVHTLSSASPETRKQGDFKLGYEWDEAAVELGGGISLENDYESRFGNVGGRMDFNQKLTTLNLNLSYTNSITQATLDHDAAPYIYESSNPLASYNSTHTSSQLANVGTSSSLAKVLTGNREDWATVLGLTQVLNKQAIIEASLGYTNSAGYMANPYKTVTTVFVDPAQTPGAGGVLNGTVLALLEKRPNERNQWSANFRYVQQIESLNAALHASYQLFHDDWGITAHTFELDWAQPMGDSWMVTPRIRYYSQDAADFYVPYMVSKQATPGGRFLVPLNTTKLPANYSSDQRLSAFGALSGGIAINKQFAKGVSLEVGAEYYTHAGSLMLGGAGEGAYADFNYYMVNAALKVDLSALSLSKGKFFNHSEHIDHSEHAGHYQDSGDKKQSQPHHNHHNAPAGVMFDHLLGNAGDFMVGYRYMYAFQGGSMQHGADNVSDRAIINAGCNGKPCYVAPNSMNMHMHMLDLMYAPTDWLTLMLMPQFLDMNMAMQPLEGAPNSTGLTNAAVQHSQHPHNTGGIGDTSLYALFKLFDLPGHHFHATLGISAPTGDVGIQLRDTHGVAIGFIHYGMQLGSGTWDFKPSLTYTGELDEWSWGAQLNGITRLEDRNSSGFAYGDIFQGTAWGNYQLSNWLSASVRGVYTLQGQNTGAYNGKYAPIGPMDYASSYGGRYWDVGFGLSAAVPSGDLQGNRLSFEWLQPVHDEVNGYQLPREGALSATWNYGF